MRIVVRVTFLSVCARRDRYLCCSLSFDANRFLDWQLRARVIMIERDHVVGVLRSCFPEAADDVVYTAVDRILGLADGWQEVTAKDEEMGYHYSVRCPDICYLADQISRGAEYRLFLKSPSRRW